MNPKTVQFQYDINRMNAVNLVATIHIDDYDTRFLEVLLYDRGGALDVSGSTAMARFVTQSGYLLSDSVPCAVEGNTVTVPVDAAAVQSQACTLKIEINLTNDGKVLTLPFPLFVRVRGSVLDDAQITPESEGTIPELLKKVKDELERVGEYVDEAQLWESFDFVMLGASNLSPSLYFERKGDSYALYYNDSDGEKHELFDFANVGTDFQKKIYDRTPPAFPSDEYQIGDLFLSTNKIYRYAGKEWLQGVGVYAVYQKVGRRIKYSRSAPPDEEEHTYVSNFDTGDLFVVLDRPMAANSQGRISGDVYLCTDVLFHGVVGSNKMNYHYSWKKLPFNASTLAGYDITDAYTKTETDSLVTDTLDSAITGDLKIDNTVDQTFNPSGHYMLYYIDGKNVRHNLFDFSVLPMSYTLTPQDKTDIADIVLQELPTTQGVLYGD